MKQTFTTRLQLQWNDYSAKYLNISPREQVLILGVGLIVVFMGFFNFGVDVQITEIKNIKKKISQTQSAIQLNDNAILSLERRLLEDPNEALKKQVAYYEKKASRVDEELLTLTSGLIDPVQMRHALMDLLKVQKNVSLLSFELLGAKSLIAPQSTDKLTESDKIGLYKHSVKIKLKGGYFQLRDYLKQLESLQWKFFWNEFNYQLIEYPNSELEIEIFSLSTHEEFVGV